MMGLIGQVWTRGIPVELTGTNSPKAYIIFFEVCWLVCLCLRPLYGFEITISQVCGDYSERETPGSIPNPEVKALCADGTALVTVWESRSLPHLFFRGSSCPLWAGAILF